VRVAFAAVVAWLCLVTGALAQDGAPAEDGGAWDFVEGDGAVTATVAYEGALAIAVRCEADASLRVILIGLPAAGRDEFERTIEATGPDGQLAPSTWVVSGDLTAAFAITPSVYARTLRKGGTFSVRAPTTDGRRMRYQLDLPADATAIDRVLQACGRPLVDERDGAPRPGDPAFVEIDWGQRPMPEYPSRAEAQDIGRGVASLDCRVLETGRLTDCQIESEFPPGMGFGPAAVEGTRTARLTREGQAAAGGRARFTIRFRLH
jgi:hypothetical protein